MLRTYKHDGKTWRYEEGEQPAHAVLVSSEPVERETPESRAAKAQPKRAAAKKEDAR